MPRSRQFRITVVVLLLLHAAVVLAGVLAPYDYAEQHRNDAYSPPNSRFLLGTDGYGRDVLSRVLYGGQISLATGVIATGLALGIGLIWGMAAGFFGGWTDRLLMRGSELFAALPWLYLLLAVRAGLPL